MSEDVKEEVKTKDESLQDGDHPCTGPAGTATDLTTQQISQAIASGTWQERFTSKWKPRVLPRILLKPYACELCDEKFLAKSHLQRHALIHKDEKPIECEIEVKKLTQSTILEIHKDSLDSSKCYMCEFCDLTFETTNELKKHILTHTVEIPPFACGICSKQFIRKLYLDRHICTQQFKRKNYLDVRSDSHGVSKPHVCEMCDMKFNTRSRLKYHRLTHVIEKQYACAICLKRVPSSGSLKEHMASHMETSWYKCNVCLQLYSMKSTLKRHLDRHDDARRYACEKCHQTFFTNGSLQYHISTHTAEKEYYGCAICPKRFSSKRSLNCHNFSSHM